MDRHLKEWEDVYNQEERGEWPRKVGDCYAYRIIPSYHLDHQLFGNDAGIQSLEIVLREPVALFFSGIGPVLSHVLPYGIVVSCDSAEMADDAGFGFHNFFIPWSNIVSCYQYIQT